MTLSQNGIEFEITASKFGGFCAIGRFLSVGILAIGPTAEGVESVARKVIIDRQETGKKSLASILHSGKVVAAFAEAEKELSSF